MGKNRGKHTGSSLTGDHKLQPRIRQVVEEGSLSLHDIDEVVDKLIEKFAEYKRKPQLPFRASVANGMLFSFAGVVPPRISTFHYSQLRRMCSCTLMAPASHMHSYCALPNGVGTSSRLCCVTQTDWLLLVFGVSVLASLREQQQPAPSPATAAATVAPPNGSCKRKRSDRQALLCPHLRLAQFSDLNPSSGHSALAFPTVC